ncbi:sulfotransferase domain-containing protein [Rhodohalobacter sulfatireducens]|uniref:Sulfotransferase domain-containing protein n=1 Tax=Rhodohalobacter sulfatireducens TaxID=2911366 RepID=A0ABS9KIW2_9BACT|nr:sulfotransferase domain-containing protein [Rhodohalobacter sulfatireducens]MCG2590799.1 sulfotransferase domain-containing protein [Rhodohalobacter sulfatireducens]
MIRGIVPYSLRKFTSFHFPGNNNIILFSTPRSGSTWLLEMIAAQPRIKTVREPLNVRLNHICEMLGLDSWDEIYDEKKYPDIVQYLKKFSKNLEVHPHFKREKPLTETWHPITNRLLYKLLHGLENRIADLKEELQAKAIILIRHPIPVTLSRTVYPRLHAYHQSGIAKHFKDEELTFAQNIITNGTDFEKGIVSWCFQNKVFLSQRNEGLLITYEELVMNRMCVIPKITDYLDIPETDKMLSRSFKASGSTGKSTESRIQLLEKVEKGEENYRKLIEKWKMNTSPDMIERVQEILDAFHITAYRADDIMPSKDLLLC